RLRWTNYSNNERKFAFFCSYFSWRFSHLQGGKTEACRIVQELYGRLRLFKITTCNRSFGIAQFGIRSIWEFGR
uniref:Ovule protein n=1 Tax=Romanomermis culicivorax TaxID=13658 RepID=A0A915HLE4_ROMCU